MREITGTDLGRILRECAGGPESLAWDDDAVLDTAFEELEYDSIALLEAVARIQRDYGVRVDDGAVAEAATPRDLLARVNQAATEPA